jgi:sugar lactone lactonase YvrE
LNLYYSNGGQAVRKYVIGGSDTVLATERTPGQPFNQLLHLTVAPTGDVYVSDLSGPVYKITAAGTVSEFVTVSANGINPDSGWLAFDSAGNLFVAGVFQGGIFKVTPDGSQNPFVSTQDAPNVRGMAVSPSGDLYIADADANTITRVIGAGPSTVAPAAVPTLSEWAMILFGLVLAGGAMLMVQRRRILA